GFPGAAEVREDLAIRSPSELLVAMKEPSGFDPTVTLGTVSRISSAANAALADQQVLNARTVQHNAAINPGNSGGPLLDACAAVIGVNSFFAKGAQGVFFSIHSREVIGFLRELKIGYSTVGHPCAGELLSSAGGLLLPFLIAMSAAFGVAALVFALRNRTRSLEIIGRYATRWNEQGRAAPAQGAPSLGWAAACDAVSLQAVAGGAAYTLQSGKALMVGRGGQC